MSFLSNITIQGRLALNVALTLITLGLYAGSNMPPQALSDPDPIPGYASIAYTFETTYDTKNWDEIVQYVVADNTELTPLLAEYQTSPTFELWQQIAGLIGQMISNTKQLRHDMIQTISNSIVANPSKPIGAIPNTDPPLGPIVDYIMSNPQFGIPQVPALPPEPTPPPFAPSQGSFLTDEQEVVLLQAQSGITTMLSQIQAGTFSSIPTLLSTNLPNYRTALSTNNSANIISAYNDLVTMYGQINTAAVNAIKAVIQGVADTTPLGSIINDQNIDSHLQSILYQLCQANTTPINPYYLLGPIVYAQPANLLSNGSGFFPSTSWTSTWNVTTGSGADTTVLVGGGPFGDNALQMIAGDSNYLTIQQSVALTGNPNDVIWVTAYVKNSDPGLCGSIGISANSGIRNDMYYSDGAVGQNFSTEWRPVYFKVILTEVSPTVNLYLSCPEGTGNSTQWASIQIYNDPTVTLALPGGTYPDLTWMSFNPNMSHWPQHKAPYTSGGNLLPVVQTITTPANANTPYIDLDLSACTVVNTSTGQQIMISPLLNPVAVVFNAEPFLPLNATYDFTFTVMGPSSFNPNSDTIAMAVFANDYTFGQVSSTHVTMAVPTGTWSEGTADPNSGNIPWTFTGTWESTVTTTIDNVGNDNQIPLVYPALAPQFKLTFPSDLGRIVLLGGGPQLSTTDSGTLGSINYYRSMYDPNSWYMQNRNTGWSTTVEFMNHRCWLAKIVANDIGTGNPGLLYYDESLGGMVMPSIIVNPTQAPFTRAEGSLLTLFTIQGEFTVTTLERLTDSSGNPLYPWETPLQDAFWIYGGQDHDVMGVDVFEIDWEQCSAPYDTSDPDQNPSHWFRANTYTGGSDGSGQHVTQTVNLYEFCTSTHAEIKTYLDGNGKWFGRQIQRQGDTTLYNFVVVDAHNQTHTYQVYSQEDQPMGGRAMQIYIQPEQAFWGTNPNQNPTLYNVVLANITVTQAPVNSTVYPTGYPLPSLNDYLYGTPNTPQAGIPITPVVLN